MGKPHVVNHEHIPAACFTHPEIAMVGLTEEQAKARATEQGFPLGKSLGYFKANSKALAENESDGIAKVIVYYDICTYVSIDYQFLNFNLYDYNDYEKVLYNKNTEEIIGVHIIGLHAADLIQECANAMMAGTTVREIAMMVNTLIILDVLYIFIVCIIYRI